MAVRVDDELDVEVLSLGSLDDGVGVVGRIDNRRRMRETVTDEIREIAISPRSDLLKDETHSTLAEKPGRSPYNRRL